MRRFTSSSDDNSDSAIFTSRVPRPSLANALVETIAPGCTMVWKRGLQQILRDSRPCAGILMHNSCVYLVASVVGTVSVEPQPLVRYRIYGANAFGVSNGLLPRLRRFTGSLSQSGPTLESQAKALLGSSRACGTWPQTRCCRWPAAIDREDSWRGPRGAYRGSSHSTMRSLALVYFSHPLEREAETIPFRHRLFLGWILSKDQAFNEHPGTEVEKPL